MPQTSNASAISRMIAVGRRFAGEAPVHQEVFPAYSRLPIFRNIHPAAHAFMDELHEGGWIIYDWDYFPWAEEHRDDLQNPAWLSELSLLEIRRYLTWYSRMLRNGSSCPEMTVSDDIASGVLPALITAIEAVP